MAHNEIRLNRYLAQCGLGSRRTCDTFITAGKIAVNGKVVSQLGSKIDPIQDRVEYKGKTVKAVESLEYIAYHKSRGVIVTLQDPEGRETIYDALKKNGFTADHLKYIGRLDRNSEGLLLLTNDGAMIHALTHPRFQIKKVYRVKIASCLTNTDAEKMVRDGVPSEGQLLCAGAIRALPLQPSETGFWYEIDLYEGKNRHIRRMFEGLGYEILRLKRTQYSVIKLGNLQRGAFRHLEDREIKALRNKGYDAVKQSRRSIHT